MRISRRSLFFLIFLTLLFILNSILLLLAFWLFPAYGGFTRQIIFIKPNDGTNSSGYFIIIDELSPKAQNHDIDWLLHSRGKLEIADDDQSFISTVPSYISNDQISLKVNFLEEIEKIDEEEGYFLPTHYDDDYPHDDIDTSYIKAKYSGSENPIMATVLYPINNSDSTQSFPIIEEASGLYQIGTNDYLYYNLKKNVEDFSSPVIEFDGKLFFLRRNKTAPLLLEYFYLQGAEFLEFENKEYFLSDEPVGNVLATYSNQSQISGAIKTSVENDISMYCPFLSNMILLNGENTTFSQTGSIISFSIEESCSFVISSNNNFYNPEYDPLRESAEAREMPEYHRYDFDEDLIEDLQHPYILFNQTELANIRLKLNDTSKPWKYWYGNYTSSVDTIVATDIDEYDEEDRHIYVSKLALKFAIDGGYQYLGKIKEFLLDMDNIHHYSQDLKRAYAVQAYSIAFDIVYNDLKSSDRKEITELLEEHADPLMEMELYPENNHRVVDAGGLGCAGLVLKDVEMIDKAIETILIYYYTLNPRDGGSYEGYSYNAFAMDEFMKFAVGLKRLDGYNFFSDRQVLSTFDFMAETLGPLGMPALYEDCTFSSRLQEVLLVAAANLNGTHPTRAANFQYIWEQRQNNTQYKSKSNSYYSYLDGGSPLFNRIVLYNVNDTIVPKPFSSRKEIWKESNMAFLRSDDKPNGLYLSFNCKDYIQSHTHFDENSFEIWAYGAYIVSNPGYPGFGKKYHDWTIATESSNTLLIGGSGQLQETADGLVASISSPYFSMVIGKAEEIYNDLGSYEYAKEFYTLIITNFILIGLAYILFFLIARKEEAVTEDLEIQPKEDENIEDRRDVSKLGLLKMSFFHPDHAIDYIYRDDPFKEDARFISRIIKLIISGLMILFFLFLVLNMKTVVDYHLQYYEDKAASIFEALKIIVLIILYGGILLTFLCSLAAIKMYNRFNRMLIYKALEDQRTEITKKDISFVSSLSLIWQFPVLIFAFILLYFTSAETFKTAIETVSVGSGSITSIYSEILVIILEFIRNCGLILLFEIPFLLITLRIFGVGIYKNTNGQISKKKARQISLTSILILLILSILILLSLVILLKYGFSMVTIEGYIED